MTNKEAIYNLNHIYGIVSPDIQRSLDLAIKALEDKPQGEWIFTDDDYGFWHCNQCKAIGSPHNNYCPNCGAQMKTRTDAD